MLWAEDVALWESVCEEGPWFVPQDHDDDDNGDDNNDDDDDDNNLAKEEVTDATQKHIFVKFSGTFILKLGVIRNYMEDQKVTFYF